jgi:septin family protein
MKNAEQEAEVLKHEQEKDEKDKVNTERLHCALTFIKTI